MEGSEDKVRARTKSKIEVEAKGATKIKESVGYKHRNRVKKGETQGEALDHFTSCVFFPTSATSIDFDFATTESISDLSGASPLKLQTATATTTQQPALDEKHKHDAAIQHASIWTNTEDEVSIFCSDGRKTAAVRAHVYKKYKR